MDVCLDGTRASEASYRLAKSLALSVDGTPILEDHLSSLAMAPEHDLESFADSRGRARAKQQTLAALLPGPTKGKKVQRPRRRSVRSAIAPTPIR